MTSRFRYWQRAQREMKKGMRRVGVADRFAVDGKEPYTVHPFG
nr:hypothetical protein [Gordonia amicalis]